MRRTTHDSRPTTHAYFRAFVFSCAAVGMVACSLPPLRGKAQVGKDPYAVVAADGNGGGDLYAIVGAGNEVVPLTYTPVREFAPALSPEGGMLAFLRAPMTGRAGRPAIWVINLLGGSERELALPDSVTESFRRLAWSEDGRTVYAETEAGLWQWPAPPGEPKPERVAPGERARADSALSVLLGRPVFASVVDCDSAGAHFCVETRDGRREPLSAGAEAPARWGADSLAWIEAGKIEIRPLAGGAARLVELTGSALNPTSLTYFPGVQ